MTTAVNAAVLQTYSSKEIILIDDGSNKKTKKAIASVSEKVDLLIEQDNRGQAISRNKGIAKATGEYILNWDSDDLFEPDFAAKAIEKFKEDPNIKIVTCKAHRFYKRKNFGVFTPRGGTLNNFLFNNSALGSSMFKKTDWKACGGYEEGLPILGYEDWEFYISLLKPGGYVYVIPEVLFHYQVRPNSTTAKIRAVRHEKYKYIILKHADLYQANFEGLIAFLITKLTQAENESHRRRTSIDYRVGSWFLTPIRWLKRNLR